MVEELRDEHREVLMGAMHAILERDTIAISQLALPARELRALEYLQAAVSGKEALGRFVYAEDRRTMLEQALAILQPNLAQDVEVMVEQVDVLRGHLVNLEDAQEEKFGWEQGAELEEVPETTEKPDEDRSLDGPEREVAKPASTVADGGPEAPEKADAPSTLSKGAAVEREEAASTLSSGDPVPDRPSAASSLGHTSDDSDGEPAATEPASDKADAPAKASSSGEPAKPGKKKGRRG